MQWNCVKITQWKQFVTIWDFLAKLAPLGTLSIFIFFVGPKIRELTGKFWLLIQNWKNRIMERLSVAAQSRGEDSPSAPLFADIERLGSTSEETENVSASAIVQEHEGRPIFNPRDNN